MSKKAAKKNNVSSNTKGKKVASPAKKSPLKIAKSAPKRDESNGSSNTKTAHWTFLTNHAHVLILIKKSPDMPLREVASLVGITERAVQRIVHELDVAGYITITRIGRRNHYWVNEDLHLRHPIEQAQTIGQLIRLVTP